MAMLMGQLAAPLPVRSLLFDRGVETVIGAVVGTVLVVVLELARRRRRTGQAWPGGRPAPGRPGQRLAGP
jgi:hypothetical protein